MEGMSVAKEFIFLKMTRSPPKRYVSKNRLEFFVSNIMEASTKEN